MSCPNSILSCTCLTQSWTEKKGRPCLSGPLVVACRKKNANFDREAQDRLCSMVMQPPSPPFSDAQPCSPHSSASGLLSDGTDGQALPVRVHTLQLLQPPCILVLLRTYPSPNMSNSSPAILIIITITTGGNAEERGAVGTPSG